LRKKIHQQPEDPIPKERTEMTSMLPIIRKI